MDSTEIKDLYRQMLRIRLFEESLIPLINDGTIKCPTHLCIGQEAVAVGVCSALRPQDHIYSHHRSHGHYLAKGGDMKRLTAELYGKKTGCCHGRAGSMHIMDPDVGFMGISAIVASTVALAVGDAMATKLRKEDRVTVAVFGDGAMGEGIVYESINLAVLYNLPIIFVCENNGYATHMPLKKCVGTDDLYLIPYDCYCNHGDGNDVESVQDLTNVVLESLEHNANSFPAFLEFNTYRLCGHVGPDDKIMGEHIDIRPKEEIEYWKKNDPIKAALDLRDHDFMTEWPVINRLEIEQEIAEAHKFAKESAWPEDFPGRGYGPHGEPRPVLQRRRGHPIRSLPDHQTEGLVAPGVSSREPNPGEPLQRIDKGRLR